MGRVRDLLGLHAPGDDDVVDVLDVSVALVLPAKEAGRAAKPVELPHAVLSERDLLALDLSVVAASLDDRCKRNRKGKRRGDLFLLFLPRRTHFSSYARSS